MKDLGVFAAPLTPFSEHGALRLEQLPPYISFLLEAGVAGLLCMGTNGEFASLTIAERLEATEATLSAVGGRVPVVVNVGTTALGDAAALARHARAAGADGVALLPPYYFPLRDDGFLEVARRVADAFEGPLYLYNIPRYVGYRIPAAVVARCHQDGIARGLKDSSQDMTYFRDVRQRCPELELFVGSDTTLVEGLREGADGAVSGMANAFPELVVAVYRAFRRGAPDLERLRGHVLALREAFAGAPYMAGARAAANLRGFDLGPPRLPLVDAGPDTRSDLHARLAAIEQRVREDSAA